jgi:hypothetical protein
MQCLFVRVQFAKGMGGKQYPAPSQPRSGVSDQVPNHPYFVVKVEVPHMADVAVQCGELGAVEFLRALQVRVASRDAAGFLWAWIHGGSMSLVLLGIRFFLRSLDA